jgi:hypothetical protein
MKFDLDKHLFDSKVIGSKVSNSLELKHVGFHTDGYSIAQQDGKFLNLFLNFTDGYHDYRPFKGEVVFNGVTYFFDENTTVDKIESIFVNVVTGFEDDVEISRTFLVNGIELECSWYYDSKDVSFTYISAELDTGFHNANRT